MLQAALEEVLGPQPRARQASAAEASQQPTVTSKERAPESNGVQIVPRFEVHTTADSLRSLSRSLNICQRHLMVLSLESWVMLHIAKVLLPPDAAACHVQCAWVQQGQRARQLADRPPCARRCAAFLLPPAALRVAHTLCEVGLVHLAALLGLGRRHDARR